MRLLIIGESNPLVTAAGRIAFTQGAKVSHVDSVEAGLNALRSGQGADLVMIEVTFNIKDFIASLESERIVVTVVACGIRNDTDAAVKAIKAGAKEYIPLPPDPDLITAVLQAVCTEADALVSQDIKMQEQIKLAEKLAPSEATIFITGESGTGKEVMARFIHAKSKRAEHKLVSVNCAAIPENLLESELFGHEKGAFTGAIARRIGKFEEASGGTLFLDEISEMHPRLQAKLLRAIQEREIDRVGGSKPVKIDIRLIATSNRNMLNEVKNGNFREDLYFRINVASLELPPLRQRPKDIEILAEHFIKKYAQENQVAALPLSPEGLKALQSYPWPGNVRELENTLHRAVILGQGETSIRPEALKLPTLSTKASGAHDLTQNTDFVGRTVSDVERELILNTLGHCLGNRTHAATILGISIRTLRNKLKQYMDENPNMGLGHDHQRIAS